MLLRLAYRFLTEVRPRLLANFTIGFGVNGLIAVERYKRRLAKGRHFPPFIFMSITNACNLRCQGCWVSVDKPAAHLSVEQIDRVISECKTQGGKFFGLLGGEPLLHKGLFDILHRHRDCYFQLFTNGQLLTGDVADELARAGNVTPLISVEGFADVSDVRRGGTGVYSRSLAAIKNCRCAGLITGVATSLCKSNISQLLDEQFIDRAVDMGVHYLWYYIYRPVGANPCPELAIDADQIVAARKFIVNQRAVKPIIIVDAYWDDRGRAICPAAAGISYHISPWGAIEPCPPIQFAAQNINDGDLVELIERSEFLADFRKSASAATRGCVLMDNPKLLAEIVARNSAADSSGRSTAAAELAAMTPHPSHNQPANEIPERSFVYRFAKKHWFFGFGAYG